MYKCNYEMKKNRKYIVMFISMDQRVIQYYFNLFKAFWITYYCLKKLFDIDDNFDSSDTDVTFVRQTMCGHFGVSIFF